MEIGIKIGPALGSEVRVAAEMAERMGFGSVWLSERVVIPLDKPHPYEPMIDPWIGLSYVAAVTERVKLGTSVSQIALRHPVLMARELATLDRLSNGRVIVGAGAGWVVEEFTATGVPFDDRGGRLSEHLRVLKHLFSTPDQPWHGKYYDIPPVGIVQPVTPGGPPLFVGGFTPAGYRRAAKYSDGFISGSATADKLAEVRATITALREKYGRIGHFPFYAQATTPDSPDAARAQVRSLVESGVECAIIAYPGDVVEAMRAHETTLRVFIDAAGSAGA